MSFVKCRLGFVTLSATMLVVNETNRRDAAHAQVPDHSSATDAAETTQAQIARALSAGPPEVAKSARVVDTDAQGKMIVLREGNQSRPTPSLVLPTCWREPHSAVILTPSTRRAHLFR